MKIVIADDNADSAESLARVLRLAGHDVRVVGDGERAVELARRVKPDVVVLDIGMPRLNGYGAARRIRAEVWGRRMVLVALTGWGQKQDRERAIEAGFDLHLVKPVDARVLDALLRRACSEERVV